jgi:hypothetical protein
MGNSLYDCVRQFPIRGRVLGRRSFLLFPGLDPIGIQESGDSPASMNGSSPITEAVKKSSFSS